MRQFVIDNWGAFTIEELAKATNRTNEQIMSIQWKYGLKSLYAINDNNLFTLIELGELLALSRDTMRRWTTKFGLKKQELNKGNKKRFVVDVRDVLPFLEENKTNIAPKTYRKCKTILTEYFNKNLDVAV